MSNNKRKQYTNKFKLEILNQLDNTNMTQCAKQNDVSIDMIRNWRAKRPKLEELSGEEIDLTALPRRKRKSYTPEFKLLVVEKAGQESISKCATEHQVTRTMIRNWRKSQAELEAKAAERKREGKGNVSNTNTSTTFDTTATKKELDNIQPPRSRRSYSAATKLQVLCDLEHKSVRQVAIDHGITRKMVRNWRSNQALYAEAQKYAGKRLPGIMTSDKSRLPGCGPKTNAQLEEQLTAWINSQSDNNSGGEIKVSDKDIQEKAREIAKGIPGLENFAASKGYVDRFKNRYKSKYHLLELQQAATEEPVNDDNEVHLDDNDVINNDINNDEINDDIADDNNDDVDNDVDNADINHDDNNNDNDINDDNDEQVKPQWDDHLELPPSPQMHSVIQQRAETPNDTRQQRIEEELQRKREELQRQHQEQLQQLLRQQQEQLLQLTEKLK